MFLRDTVLVFLGLTATAAMSDGAAASAGNRAVTLPLIAARLPPLSLPRKDAVDRAEV